MTRDSKKWQYGISCFCMMLAVVCAFCVFLPYIHECDESQCAVCALCSLQEQLWLPEMVFGGISITAAQLGKVMQRGKTCEEHSLVQLKVKLSN